MGELILDRDQRLALRARAHHLDPVVLLGSAGLTEAIFKETDRALTAHELIKVRIRGDDRDEREAVGTALADRLGAARIQAIGKLLVLYRPRPEEKKAEERGAGRRPPAADSKAPPGKRVARTRSTGRGQPPPRRGRRTR